MQFKVWEKAKSMAKRIGTTTDISGGLGSSLESFLFYYEKLMQNMQAVNSKIPMIWESFNISLNINLKLTAVKNGVRAIIERITEKLTFAKRADCITIK